jgi:hypothetical protein
MNVISLLGQSSLQHLPFHIPNNTQHLLQPFSNKDVQQAKVIFTENNIPSTKQELVAVVTLAALRSKAWFRLNLPSIMAFMETANSDTRSAATMACI